MTRVFPSPPSRETCRRPPQAALQAIYKEDRGCVGREKHSWRPPIRRPPVQLAAPPLAQ